MSAARHTPGPWRASDGALIRVVAGSNVVCGVHKQGRFTGEHDIRETRANARLIAAAPDLLAALRALDEVLDFSKPGTGFEMIEDASVLNPAMKLARAALAKVAA